MCELVFFTQLSRIATRSNIQPLAVELPDLPNKLELYLDYFGCGVAQGNDVSIRFSAEDAKRPFLTSNAAMWDFFENQLNQKLADHYLESSNMSLGEIAFLNGFRESNSFIRAYSTWKGVSPGYYREQRQQH
jgi:hypothetical protein